MCVCVSTIIDVAMPCARSGLHIFFCLLVVRAVFLLFVYFVRSSDETNCFHDGHLIPVMTKHNPSSLSGYIVFVIPLALYLRQW